MRAGPQILPQVMGIYETNKPASKDSILWQLTGKMQHGNWWGPKVSGGAVGVENV